MTRVWNGNRCVGTLSRQGRGTAFAYDAGVPREDAVSMAMPVQSAWWGSHAGVHPAFQMNLPEGFLRDRLAEAFPGEPGGFNDLDLLSAVGRSMAGRLRYAAPGADPTASVPRQPVDAILRGRRPGDELPEQLFEAFAPYSGVSGVQPKALVRDADGAGPATHIVKFWIGPFSRYGQLAANEFFCLEAAAKSGLEVPRHRLSELGDAIVVDRFDLLPDGTCLALEDFCSLNGRPTEEKYRGSYEKALFKRAANFLPEAGRAEGLGRLFALFALNAAVRNGDAHMKNFALVHDGRGGPASVAPVYDVITTTAYLPRDLMGLQLDGTKRWPTRARLLDLATRRCMMEGWQASAVLERIGDGVSDAAAGMRLHAREHPGFREVAGRMLAQWEVGLETSLGFVPKAWSHRRPHTVDLREGRRVDAAVQEYVRLAVGGEPPGDLAGFVRTRFPDLEGRDLDVVEDGVGEILRTLDEVNCVAFGVAPGDAAAFRAARERDGAR